MPTSTQSSRAVPVVATPSSPSRPLPSSAALIGSAGVLMAVGAASLPRLARRSRADQRQRVVVKGVEDDLFGSASKGSASKKTEEKPSPELLSEKGVDYSVFNETLASGDFKAADAESRRLLIELAGPAAVKRGWVYFAEVKTFPETDMKTMDALWRFYSDNKFGFTEQRKVWNKTEVRGQFDKFAEEVSWFTDTWTNRNWPDEFVYDKVEAVKGHLPLTNCIRGAQVLQELMEHPAFEKKKKVKA